MTGERKEDDEQRQQSIPVGDDDFELPPQPFNKPFVTSSTWYHDDPDTAKMRAYQRALNAAESVCTDDECSDVDLIEYVEIDMSKTEQGSGVSLVASVKVRWQCVLPWRRPGAGKRKRAMLFSSLPSVFLQNH